MDGHASDLRTGLPWQMVEIHEPVRMLFVIETAPERLMKVVNASPSLKQLMENRWIQGGNDRRRFGPSSRAQGRRF